MSTTTRLSPARQTDAALLLLRVVAGSVFAAHGAQKLFVFGLAGVTSGFAGMGIPLAEIAAPAVAFIEFVGGLLLMAGLFTRLAGIGLALNMLGAILFVHAKNGFFMPNGVEFALTLFAAAIAVALTGPGAFAFDALRGRTGTRGTSGFDARLHRTA